MRVEELWLDGAKSIRLPFWSEAAYLILPGRDTEGKPIGNATMVEENGNRTEVSLADMVVESRPDWEQVA